MTNLVPNGQAPGTVPSLRYPAPVSRRTTKALGRLSDNTLVRMATVQAEEFVQVEKLKCIDNLARDAASGQAMLLQWTGLLSQGDPIVAAELHCFVDIARLGKMEIMADSVDSFCRESRQ
jgi:hypothetical protein